MKFTLSWLKDHLDTNASLEQIGEKLTAIGLEVESITDGSVALKPFTVAKILEAVQHPNAEKLRVCKVQSDAGELQIVCGAPNARAGIYVALAKEGAVIPNGGMVIKKTKIRDVESRGMLCSRDELALPGDSAGIIELPEAPIGTPIADVLGLTDPVIDIAITPNRADCLGVRGVATDLAAAGVGKLKPLAIPDVKGSFPSPVKVSIANTASCPQFTGAYIKGVKNGPSPDWLKKRLEAIGKRSISALVDITNYMTFDLGRPLHVFDAAKLKGNIVARDAKAGEKLLALDGKEYALPEGATVIADDSGALGLGGIIGGEATGCQLETTDVFLEVALFDPATIAKAGRALAIDSDARYRFERGVDVGFVENAARLAIKLIKELCGGEASELVHAGATPEWKRSITLRFERIAQLSGVTIEHGQVKNILHALGFACLDVTGGLMVVPPSWRRDVEGEADVIEECLRIIGYDNIPPTPLPKLPAIAKPALNTNQKRAHLVKRALAARGFKEAVTWSFLPEAQAKLFGGTNTALKLINPISADLDTMRPNLLPNLLAASARNAARGFKDVGLFEVGLQFTDITPAGQKLVAAGIRTGNVVTASHENGLLKQATRPTGAFDAKAEAMAALKALGVEKCDITTVTPGWYHPGRSGALTLGGKIILGYFGEIHPALLKSFDVEAASGFEIFLEAIPVARSKKPKALVVSDFQAVERDFAFLVDTKVTAAEITKAIAAAEKKLITSVELFDVYAGKGMAEGKKSVAVKVTLQAADRTLSEADIITVSQAVIAAAAAGFGGQLRQ